MVKSGAAEVVCAGAEVVDDCDEVWLGVTVTLKVVGTTVVSGTLLLPECTVVVIVVEPVVRESEGDCVGDGVLPEAVLLADD